MWATTEFLTWDSYIWLTLQMPENFDPSHRTGSSEETFKTIFGHTSNNLTSSMSRPQLLEGLRHLGESKLAINHGLRFFFSHPPRNLWSRLV